MKDIFFSRPARLIIIIAACCLVFIFANNTAIRKYEKKWDEFRLISRDIDAPESLRKNGMSYRIIDHGYPLDTYAEIIGENIDCIHIWGYDGKVFFQKVITPHWILVSCDEQKAESLRLIDDIKSRSIYRQPGLFVAKKGYRD